MNTRGNLQYSKAVQGTKQPSIIMDQHHKLIFIYPMLISRSLTKYKNLLREFHSISMMKELFVSNALNIISMTSKIPNPLDTERVNVGELVGNAILAGRGMDQRFPTGYDQSSKNEIQNRIDEKTERIKKYLYSDPQLKSFMPHIDFVTLENLVDVPVIIGTKSFDADDFGMLLFLTTSVGLQRPLTTWNNVQYVSRTLMNANPEHLSYFFSNLSEQTPKSGLDKYLERHPRLRHLHSKVKNKLGIQDKSRIHKSPLQQHAEKEESELEYNENEAFQILKFTKKDLNETELYFKFMTEINAFKSQFGINPSSGQMSGVIKTVNPEMNKITTQIFQEFITLTGSVLTPILRSISNILHPVPSSSNFDFLLLKEKIIDTDLNSKMYSLINDDIMESLKNAMSESTADVSDTNIKELKKMCQEIPKTEDILTSRFTTLTNSTGFMGKYYGLDSLDYEMKDVKAFTSELEKLTATLSSFIRSYQMSYSKIVPNASSVFSRSAEQIRNSVSNFFREYKRELDNNQVVPYVTDRGFIPKDAVISRFMPRAEDAVFNILFFFLLYRVQIATCQLVDVMEIKIETATKEVVEWPNYIIVIPIEFVNFIHTMIMAKNWKTMTSKKGFSPSQNPSITDQYTKSIVKFIAKRLQIPNIIVIDEKKQEMFYKFMHMSQITKIRMSAVENFIRQNQ